MWVVSGSWENVSHEQYKRDKDRGNVVGLGGDVVGLGSCGGRRDRSELDDIREWDWLGNLHHNSSINHHHHHHASSAFFPSPVSLLCL